MIKKPNVILITIDCLRADFCGWLNPRNKNFTPFLNKLAKESSVFTQAYATGPCTALAFPGILTGTYPLSFKGWNGKTFPGLDQRPYLPEVLHNNGYSTLAVHDQPYISDFFGYGRGFDVFKDLKMESREFLIKDKVNSFIEKSFKWLNKHGWLLPFKNLPLLKSAVQKIRKPLDPNYIPKIIASEINKSALEEIKSAQHPRFLLIHYMDLHCPYSLQKGSDSLNKEIKKANIEYKLYLSQKNLNKEDFKLIKKAYQLKVKYLDQQIKELFNNLKDEVDESLIIITADHGEEFGEHGGCGHYLSRTNSRLYKELLHVPLIVKMPNKKGAIINKIVSTAQIPATILKSVGIKLPPGMEPSLFDKNKKGIWAETLMTFSSLLDRFDLSSIKRLNLRNKNIAWRD